MKSQNCSSKMVLKLMMEMKLDGGRYTRQPNMVSFSQFFIEKSVHFILFLLNKNLGKVDIVKLLLVSGANGRTGNNDNWTPLDEAKKNGIFVVIYFENNNLWFKLIKILSI